MDGRKVRHTSERQGIRNGRNAHCQNRLDACRTRTRFFRLKAHPEGCTCGCADNRQIVRLSAITADDSLEDLYKHYSNSFRKAVDSVFGDEYPEMADQLRANVSRFSAYKANYVRQAFDDNARQFSGKDLDDANRATINQFRRWTDAELTTAGARARTAKQFTEFNEPDRRELFPCLKWLPSRAVNPRQSHMKFYNRVWRKDDTFWDNNAPGTEWNCMCDIEECDDQPTDNSKVKQPDIPKGLEGNPSVTGEIFTDKASYVTKCQNPSVPEDVLKPIMARHDEFVKYLKNNDYKDQKFDWESLGYQATHNEHNFAEEIGKFGIQRGDYERNSVEALVKSGHSVVLRSEKGADGIKQPDGYLDGVLMDIKGVEGDCFWSLNRANHQQVKTVILYFHDKTLFNINAVENKWKQLPDWINKTDYIKDKTIYIENVFCVVKVNNDYEVHKIKIPE